jgi:hypothetical protein
MTKKHTKEPLKTNFSNKGYLKNETPKLTDFL